MTSTVSRINSLTGLKVVALAFVFCIHSSFWPRFGRGWEFGWGMCVFFLVSGFLVARKHYDDAEWGGWTQSVNYVYGKFLQMWPLHLIGFCISLPAVLFGRHFVQSWSLLWQGIYNLLLQAWSAPDKVLGFSFNGPTWFLSALFFCYLLAPLVLPWIRRVRSPLVLLIVLCMVRSFVYFGQHQYHLFALDLYMSPMTRFMDFICAMAAYPVWQALFRHFSSQPRLFRFALGSLLEFVAVFTFVFFARKTVYYNYLPWVPLIFLPCVLVLAMEAGAVSRLLGMSLFRWLGVIELEFFILHGAILMGPWNHFGFIKNSFWTFQTVNLMLTFVGAVIWRFALRDPAARLMNSGTRSVFDWVLNRAMVQCPR